MILCLGILLILVMASADSYAADGPRKKRKKHAADTVLVIVRDTVQMTDTMYVPYDFMEKTCPEVVRPGIEVLEMMDFAPLKSFEGETRGACDQSERCGQESAFNHRYSLQCRRGRACRSFRSRAWGAVPSMGCAEMFMPEVKCMMWWTRRQDFLYILFMELPVSRLLKCWRG